MPYTVNRIGTKHALGDKHVTLPINVLLALPEVQDSKDAVLEFFNLPAAINVLLGGPGWERAKAVLNPSVVAPGWTRSQYLDFLNRPAVPERRRPIGYDELLNIRIEDVSTLSGPASAPHEQLGFAIRHYAAASSPTPGERPFDWVPSRPSFFGRWVKSTRPIL